MRISTESMYQTNVTDIDNLYATYQLQGQELSSGISVNVPSDDPLQIAQDLSVRTDNAVESQVGTNMTDLNNELTTVGGTLSSLTSILQSARSLAIEGASDTTNAAQRQDMATQVDQMLSEVVGLANTEYAGKFIFAGTAVPPGDVLVSSSGTPINSVTSLGNQVQQFQQLPDGQTVPTGVTLQQAFNYNAANGSASVFQTLINLRNTLLNGTVTDQSATAVNLPGQYINNAAAAPPGTTLAQLTGTGAAAILGTPLVAPGGNVSFNISDGQNVNGVTITLPTTDTVNQAVAAINAQLAGAGISVTASFNPTTQRLSLTNTQNPPQTFQINDTNGNFSAAFGLTQQATTSGFLSTQLGDIDNVLTQALNAQAAVGSTIQAVTNTSQTTSSRVLNDTTVRSNIEDTDIAKVTSQFSQTQTVLQAAYATTSRLESKTLFDYL